MFEVFKTTLTPTLLLFLCMLIGYLLNKTKRLPSNAAIALSKLETYVLVPALIINTFMQYCTVDSLKENATSLGFSVLLVACGVGLAYLLSGFFVKSGYSKNMYKYAFAFGNYIFMGNAVVPALFGQQALYQYLLFTLPLYIVGYTWGVAIMIPKQAGVKHSAFKSLLNPVVIAIVVGMALGLLDLGRYLPAFFTGAVSKLSACMGPVAMLLTGFVVGDYPIGAILKNKKVYVATLLRLFVIPAAYIALLWVLGADRQVMLLSLFSYAMPLGLNTVIFPATYGGETSTGAAMATISHPLSVVTIPLVYALFCVIFPA